MKQIDFHILSKDKELTQTLSQTINDIWEDSSIFYESGFEASLESIDHNNKPSVVICDFHLDGGNGLHLFERLKMRGLIDNIYFIIIPDTDDFEQVKSLINFGCDDYLFVDSESTVIYNRIRQAGRILIMKIELERENRKLLLLSQKLKEEADDLMKVSAKFMQARMPSSYEMLNRIASISVWIAKEFNSFSEKELKDLEIASYFSQAGRMFLPDDLLRLPVLSAGIPQHDLMHQVPVAGANIARSVQSFSSVAETIYHIYENFDGTGIPDKVQKWQIPLSSRIIRVVLDFEENKYFRNLNSKDIVEKLKSRVNRLYDGRVVQVLEKYLHEHDENFESDTMTVMIAELQAGMVLTKDIESNSGIKLIGAGSVLNEKTIKMLISHSTTDPVMGYIYVKNNINLKE